MTKTQTTIVNFKHEKATPGTHRYQEVDDAGNPLTAAKGAVVGSLYLRKSALGDTVPDRLQISIVAQ